MPGRKRASNSRQKRVRPTVDLLSKQWPSHLVSCLSKEDLRDVSLLSIVLCLAQLDNQALCTKELLREAQKRFQPTRVLNTTYSAIAKHIKRCKENDRRPLFGRYVVTGIEDHRHMGGAIGRVLPSSSSDPPDSPVRKTAFSVCPSSASNRPDDPTLLDLVSDDEPVAYYRNPSGTIRKNIPVWFLADWTGYPDPFKRLGFTNVSYETPSTPATPLSTTPAIFYDPDESFIYNGTSSSDAASMSSVSPSMLSMFKIHQDLTESDISLDESSTHTPPVSEPPTPIELPPPAHGWRGRNHSQFLVSSITVEDDGFAFPSLNTSPTFSSLTLTHKKGDDHDFFLSHTWSDDPLDMYLSNELGLTLEADFDVGMDSFISPVEKLDMDSGLSEVSIKPGSASLNTLEETWKPTPSIPRSSPPSPIRARAHASHTVFSPPSSPVMASAHAFAAVTSVMRTGVGLSSSTSTFPTFPHNYFSSSRAQDPLPPSPIQDSLWLDDFNPVLPRTSLLSSSTYVAPRFSETPSLPRQPPKLTLAIPSPILYVIPRYSPGMSVPMHMPSPVQPSSPLVSPELPSSIGASLSPTLGTHRLKRKAVEMESRVPSEEVPTDITLLKPMPVEEKDVKSTDNVQTVPIHDTSTGMASDRLDIDQVAVPTIVPSVPAIYIAKVKDIPVFFTDLDNTRLFRRMDDDYVHLDSLLWLCSPPLTLPQRSGLISSLRTGQISNLPHPSATSPIDMNAPWGTWVSLPHMKYLISRDADVLYNLLQKIGNQRSASEALETFLRADLHTLFPRSELLVSIRKSSRSISQVMDDDVEYMAVIEAHEDTVVDEEMGASPSPTPKNGLIGGNGAKRAKTSKMVLTPTRLTRAAAAALATRTLRSAVSSAQKANSQAKTPHTRKS